MDTQNQPVIIPANPHEKTIIWLHGLGADGHDFEPLAHELGFAQIKYIFPHAPIRPITLNGGMAMRGWYDLESLEFRQRQDETGILESVAAIQCLMQQEIDEGLNPQDLILAGFSQGGAIALYAALTFHLTIGGVMALSTYLPIADTFEKAERSMNQNTPVFMAHGTDDPVLPLHFATYSCERLEALGYAVEWHDYPMPHSVCPGEIKAIRNWLERQ